MRLNVFHYPLTDWCDALTMNTLMGCATVIQLKELSDCSYQPLANAFTEILPVETRHASLGEAGLRHLLADGAAARRPRPRSTTGIRESRRLLVGPARPS